MTKFSSQIRRGHGGLHVPEAPGNHHRRSSLGAGESIIAQKDAFLVAEESVTFEVTFNRKLGAGLFGGEGFIMQKFTGPGTMFAAIGGEVQEYDLAGGAERSRSTPATWPCSSPASPMTSRG